MKNLASDNFPLFGYVYTQEGRYGNPVTIRDDSELERFFNKEVALALSQHREIRITDGDDFLVFHAAGGEVLWPVSQLENHCTLCGFHTDDDQEIERHISQHEISGDYEKVGQAS